MLFLTVEVLPLHGSSSGRPAPLSGPPPASPGRTGPWSARPEPCAVRRCPPPLTCAGPAHSQTCQELKQGTEVHVAATSVTTNKKRQGEPKPVAPVLSLC